MWLAVAVVVAMIAAAAVAKTASDNERADRRRAAYDLCMATLPADAVRARPVEAMSVCDDVARAKVP